MTESYEDMRLCPVCNRIRPRSDMLFTHDCHGITFRFPYPHRFVVEIGFAPLILSRNRAPA